MNRRLANYLIPIPLALASALVLSSCSGGTTAEPADASSTDATIIVANRNEVTTLDPGQASYLQVDTAVEPLYDTLLTYDAEGSLVGALATEFTYNDDASELVITLRDDVVFHDGTPLTAADVVYTLDRIETIGTGIISQLTGYASSAVVDDHTLTIALEAPDALFASKLARIYILNSALVAENEGDDNAQGWLLNNDAGSGPYTLTSFESSAVSYARFDDYFEFDEERPGAVVLRRIDELAASFEELKAGTVDVAGLTADSVADAEAAGFATSPVTTSEAIIWMNNSTGATADPAVRKALRLAYDYTGGLTSIRGGAGTLNTTMLPAGLSCEADLPTVGQDLDEAASILEDAGIEDLNLTLRYQPAFDDQVKEATLFQSNLAEIGVTLNLEPIAFADYLTMLTDWNNIPELMLATEGLPVPEAGVMLTQVFNSQAVGTNKAAYSNPEVDELLDEVKTTPDADARCDAMMAVETILDEDAASMPLYTIDGTWAFSSKVEAPTAAPSSPSGQLAISSLRVAD